QRVHVRGRRARRRAHRGLRDRAPAPRRVRRARRRLGRPRGRVPARAHRPGDGDRAHVARLTRLSPACDGMARVLTIATANVNGIRAAYRRGMDAWIASRTPDVLLLQEVRAPDSVVNDLLD